MSAPEIIYPPAVGGGTPVGGTGTTNTIPRWTGPSTLGDSALVQSGTNAVGFGTPKTWGTNSTLNAIQLSESASLSADANTTYLAANQYWNSPGFTNLRIKANFAARYLLNGASGDHQFQIAPFGAADSAITWTTAMTILNSSGNVGIGAANPGAQLQVERAGGLSNAEYLRLRNTTVGSGSAVAQDYYVHANTVATGRIQHTWNGTTYDTTLSVWNNSLSSLQEAVRVQGGGNVGIGTASPQEKCQVYGDLKVGVLASGSFISLADEGTTAKNIGIYRAAGATSLSLGGYSAITFHASANSLGAQTERARIDSNGNIYGTSGTTGMTNGFFYIPAAAGAPTGTPTAVSGRVPMYYDTTNNEFYVYNGAWKKVALA